MGIATDVVIQHRNRINKGSGDEAIAAEIEAQEEDFEDVREALRGRLYSPAKRTPKRTRLNGDTGLAALSSTGRGNRKSLPEKGSRRPSGPTNRVHPEGTVPLVQVSNSWDQAKPQSSAISASVQRLQMPSLRRNPPRFNSSKWEAINGDLAMMMATAVPIDAGVSKEIAPQTPGPVRAKRGTLIDPKKERRTLDLAVSGDGKRVVACDTLGNTWVTDSSTGNLLQQMRSHRRARVTTCATSYTGSVAAAGGSDGKVVLWDCRGKKPSYILGKQGDKPLHREVKVNGVAFGVSTVEICPRGVFLGSVGQDGMLFLYRMTDHIGGVDSLGEQDQIAPDLIVERPKGNYGDDTHVSDAPLYHMAFSPDGQYCAACGSEGRFLLIDLRDSCPRVHEFFVGNEESALLYVAFDSEIVDGEIHSKNLAVCSTLGSMYLFSIFDILDGNEQPQLQFKMPGGPVTACAFEPPIQDRIKRRRLAAGSEGGGLIIYDLEDKQNSQITAIDAGAFGTENIHTVAYTRDARFLLVAGLGPKALVIDTNTHAIVHMLMPGKPSEPLVDFATQTADKAAMAIAEEEKRRNDARTIMAAALTPDGCHVLTALGSKSMGAVIQWDITPGAGSALLQTDDDELSTNYVPFASFINDSLDIVCSVAGGNLQIWDSMSSTLKLHIELQGIGDQSAVMSWEFNEEGGMVVATTDDDFVIAWNVHAALSAPPSNMMVGHDPHRFPKFVNPCFKHKLEGCTARPSPCGRFLLKVPQQGRSAVLYQIAGQELKDDEEEGGGQELGEVIAPTKLSEAYHNFKFSKDGSLLVGASMLGPRLDVWMTDSSPPRHITCLEPMDAESYKMQQEACFVDFSIYQVPLGARNNNSPLTGTGTTPDGWWVAAVGSPLPQPGLPGESGGIYWWALVTPTPRTITSTSYTHYPDHCPNSCSFSPNGRLLATYGTDGRVVIWEIKGKGRTGRVIGNKKLHKGGVDSLSWSRDGTMIITCGPPGDANGSLECAYVSNVNSGRVTAVLPAHPTLSFSMASFSDDSSLVCASHKEGSVALYNRGGAYDIAPTDTSFFYRDDLEMPGFFTEELTKAMIRHPLMGNHVSADGHNLITNLVRMRDTATLESVLNLQPGNVPIFSFCSGRWVESSKACQRWEALDAVDMAIENHDQGILYDLLMAMADGKVTPESWETFLGHDMHSQTGNWGRLCSEFPSLVLVFLTRLDAGELDSDVDFRDLKGKLENEALYVAGSSVYMPEDVKKFWEGKTRPKTTLMSCMSQWTWKMCRRLTAAEEKSDPVPQKCIARRCNIPWIARAGEQGFLKPLVESECPAAVYGTPIVRAVLQHKWKSFGMRKFGTECLFHCLQLLTFTTFALLYSDAESISCRNEPPGALFKIGNTGEQDRTGQIAMIFQLCSFGIALRNMCRELIQMKNVGIYKYFTSDPWNTMDFISYTLIFCILPVNIFVAPTCSQDISGLNEDWYNANCADHDVLAESPSIQAMCVSYVNESYSIPWLDQLIALEVTFLWMECMNFATGFRSTGALVRIFIQTISDISWFMALQVVLMIGFGAGFAVLFSNQQPCEEDNPFCIFNEAYDTILYSFVSMFGLLLGDIGVLDFFNSPHPGWAVILMIFYEFLVFVVLFNMLIALMADTFVEVKEKEEVEFLRGRANIICSQEETMTPKKLCDPKLFPRYLHTLVRKEDIEFKAALQSIQGGQDKTRVHLLKIQGSLEEQHREILKELKKESKIISDEFKARLKSQTASGKNHGRSRSQATPSGNTASLVQQKPQSGRPSAA